MVVGKTGEDRGMHRFAWLLLAAMLAFTSAAWARTLIDVADVNNVRLGREVTLEGYIVGHIRDDYYKFQDDTGSVRIEIDSWVSRGRSFDPGTRVRITGDVERGLAARYVSVERVTVLN
jgi:uncharacterized protein (TIGR00156 family)